MPSQGQIPYIDGRARRDRCERTWVPSFREGGGAHVDLTVNPAAVVCDSCWLTPIIRMPPGWAKPR